MRPLVLASLLVSVFAACSSADDAPVTAAGEGPVDGGGAPRDGSSPLDGEAGGEGDDGGAPGDGGESDSSADSGSDGGVDAGPPRVRYVGRIDDSDVAGPKLAWPGVRAIASFRGTEVRARIQDTDGFQGGSSSYDVLVDGALQGAKLVTASGAADYVVVTGLAAGVHTLELVKRAEANWGVSQLLSITFPGGQLLPPPPERKRRIELVGDSGMDGYGAEGTNPCVGGAPAASHNARISAAMLAGDALDADVSLVAYSGKGVVQNSYRPDTVTFSQLYGRALPDAAGSAWDPKRFPADAVVVMLGGADYSPPSPYTPAATFTDAVEALVLQVRQAHPLATILLGVGPQIRDAYPADAMARTTMSTAFQTVATRRAAAGDAKVTTFALTISDGTQETGCYGHPNVAMHQAMATELTSILKAKLGW